MNANTVTEPCDVDRTRALLAQAQQLAQQSGAVFALSGGLLSKLYLEGGPLHCAACRRSS
jgi:hypothetical protein